MSNLANRFAEEGVHVIIATEWYGKNEFTLDPRVKRVHVGLKPADEKKSRITKFFLRIRYLRAFLKAEKPDVLCAFARRANYRALIAGRGTGVPVVFSVRTDPIGHYDSFSDKVQIRLLFPRAAGAVFQTSQQRDFFRPYIPADSRVILNPVNPKYFDAPMPAEHEKTVVQSARLVDFKNQPMLIDAFLLVHEKHPDYELKIYGPDSFDGTKEILEKKIADNDAEAFIHLCGGSDSLEKELPKGMVYAFSSDWEGLPNALLEAMALGMPVVATDCPCGGPAEVIQDGVNGLLVPIKNPQALADGICRLIEDRDLAGRLGKEARKIRTRCGDEEIVAEWREYLETVITNYRNTHQ